MLMKVRIINKKDMLMKGFLKGTFNDLFEANTKKEALKLAREKYPANKGYTLGRVWKQKEIT